MLNKTCKTCRFATTLKQWDSNHDMYINSRVCVLNYLRQPESDNTYIGNVTEKDTCEYWCLKRGNYVWK